MNLEAFEIAEGAEYPRQAPQKVEPKGTEGRLRTKILLAGYPETVIDTYTGPIQKNDETLTQLRCRSIYQLPGEERPRKFGIALEVFDDVETSIVIMREAVLWLIAHRLGLL